MKMWHEIQENYKESKYASESLFLEGFTYENDLQDKDKAKSIYLKFINTYPNHDLADDVAMALKNIDMPLEELVKQFEAKNKNEIEAEGK
jgi:TolA-binding protein